MITKDLILRYQKSNETLDKIGKEITNELTPILEKLIELQESYLENEEMFGIEIIPLIDIYDYSLDFEIEGDDLVIMLSGYDETMGYTVRIPFSSLTLSGVEKWFNEKIEEVRDKMRKQLEDPEYQEYLKLKKKYESN